MLTRVVRFFEAKGFTVCGVHEVAPDLLAGAGRMGGVALVGETTRPTRSWALPCARRWARSTPARPWWWRKARCWPSRARRAPTPCCSARRHCPAEMGSRRGAGCWRKAPSRARSCASTCRRSGRAPSSRRRPPTWPGVAVEAGAVLVLDREEAVARRRCRRLCRPWPRAHPLHDHKLEPARRVGRVIGRRRPSRRDAADIETGLAAVAALAPFATGAGVVVVRHYILAIEAAEGVTAHARARGGSSAMGPALAQGGRVGAPRRGNEHEASALGALLAQAAAQELAGIAVTGPAERSRPTRRRPGSPTITGCSWCFARYDNGRGGALSREYR